MEDKQEIYTDLERRNTNFVQVGKAYFSEIDQIINFVSLAAWNKEKLIEMLEETKRQGFSLEKKDQYKQHY